MTELWTAAEESVQFMRFVCVVFGWNSHRWHLRATPRLIRDQEVAGSTPVIQNPNGSR